MQFRTINALTIPIDISYKNKHIPNVTNTQFLGITLDNSLSWKDHIDGLKAKLCKACYAIRFLRHFVSQETLRMIYFSYFHAVMSYGIIFGGNSSHSSNVFKLQKRVIRILEIGTPAGTCSEN